MPLLYLSLFSNFFSLFWKTGIAEKMHLFSDNTIAHITPDYAAFISFHTDLYTHMDATRSNGIVHCKPCLLDGRRRGDHVCSVLLKASSAGGVTPGSSGKRSQHVFSVILLFRGVIAPRSWFVLLHRNSMAKLLALPDNIRETPFPCQVKGYSGIGAIVHFEARSCIHVCCAVRAKQPWRSMRVPLRHTPVMGCA